MHYMSGGMSDITVSLVNPAFAIVFIRLLLFSMARLICQNPQKKAPGIRGFSEYNLHNCLPVQYWRQVRGMWV